ncbi:hypothetical protein HG536_0A06390 [Torulaspora globosa]|uniref:Ribosomal lysine N-methyltransferase 4 n=1 Tax=Torulaspora globosa TaxID=48254 RepID=A0A7G3ZBD8_9SACH|nr:uncharacterized protein HG536_0A06390 [Torulaspora globosa]QLL30824.1 hypothetical protein HG536_0A06390 [Torulaspora globosa]
MDGYGQATDAFGLWLKEVAQVRMSAKIAIADLRHANQGRCVIARQAIDRQEVLFEIPRSAIFNVSTSRLACRFPELKSRLLNEIGHWEGLVVCMLYEMKVVREGSVWWAYFQVLPRPDEINSLMYWSDEQLKGLKPSLIVQRVGVEEARQMYQRVVNYIKEFGPSVSDELGSVSWSDFVYVASVIMSHSFDVQVVDAKDQDTEGTTNIASDGYMKSMIPLADTLNADTRKCNANLIYDVKSLKMCATKRISAGEQLYNIYGDHPNAELLRRYGYVEWGGSKFDFGELPMETVLKVLQEEYRIDMAELTRIIDFIKASSLIADAFEGEEVVLGAYDCYSDGQIVPECVVFLQIICVLTQTPDVKSLDVEGMERMLLRIAKKCLQLVESGRITKSCAKLSECVIEARLREYPSHAFREISPDHYAISDIDSLRQRMAEKVLQSEVISLQNCVKSLEHNYKVIPDAKLLDSITKRKLPENDNKKVKRVKR